MHAHAGTEDDGEAQGVPPDAWIKGERSQDAHNASNEMAKGSAWTTITATKHNQLLPHDDGDVPNNPTGDIVIANPLLSTPFGAAARFEGVSPNISSNLTGNTAAKSPPQLP